MASGALAATGRVGPFITWLIHRQADDGHRLTTSRRHRKGLPPLAVAGADADPGRAVEGLGNLWHRLWAPRRIGWWIAVSFLVGAALFALPSAAALWPQARGLAAIDPLLQGRLYAVGACFFTSAAFLQWLEAHNNDIAALAAAVSTAQSRPPGRWRLFGWCPHNLGYLASLIQFIGTLLFNLNTGDALLAGLDWRGQNLLVWTPDVLGSLCFLAASQLALMEISHGAWSWRPRSVTWWIAVINLLGSVFFMISALAAFVLPPAEMAAPLLANGGTFAGALCFFAGAYLLIPELFETAAE